ncbi:MAG: outer membrane protein transport protein [Burkholderiales bacterium]|nr:outer membrane protein transport protein [Burkholderiales bacterium]
MKTITTAVRGALLAGAVALPFAAFATDGYFSDGYGIKSKGMGGVSIATASDSMGGANNPASMFFVGNRVDAGLDLFSPHRYAKREGSMQGMIDFAVDSDSTLFAIPEFGYNTRYNKDVTLGVTVYGNGGMNTDYEGGQINCSPLGGPSSANGLCGFGRLGVDLMQLIVAPTIAWQFSPNHAIGVSPLLAYQRFRIQGVQLFAMLSQAPENVTNLGYSNATGFGVKIGYMGKVGPVNVGAIYGSKVNMGKFDEYKGLFAEGGAFDMPEHYGFGVSFKPAGNWMVGVDYKRINYSEIASVGNPSTNQAPLGADNGPGFGWQDVDVWKFGAEYQATPELLLRAGYSKSDNPILARDVTFNILAPGVVKDHYTLGFTYAIDKSSEISGSFVHAKKNSVTGASLFNGLAPAPVMGSETISMYQNSLGIAWGKRW